MTLDEALAAGRNVASYGAGALTMFGLTKTINPDVLVSSFDHIFNGIKEISIGVGPLILTGTALWAKFRSSPSAKVADVSAMPTTKGFVTSDPELATAARVADVGTDVKLVPPTVITPKGAAA